MPISRELQYSKCDKTKLLYRTSSVLEGTRRLRRRSAAILANTFFNITDKDLLALAE